MIKVSVPATSANMGPGFDCLGIALSLYLRVSISKAETLCFEGCDDVFKTSDNLIYQSFCYIFDKQLLPIPSVRFHIESDISSTRGLGSSAACIVAGLFAGNAWLGYPYSKDALFAMATKIEGHPDNVAPAIYGGMTASFMDSDLPSVVKFEIDERFQFGAWIPHFTLSTAKARSVLPKQVQYEDVVYNISRVAVLGKALETFQGEVVAKAMKDCIHQPYRQNLIPQYEEIDQFSRRHGALAVYLSGAGPTLMVVSDQDGVLEDIANHENFSPTWQFHILQTDQIGVQIKEE